MFVLSLAGGSWLGGFAASGLAGNDTGSDRPGANETAIFWDTIRAQRAAQAQSDMPEHPVRVERAHVCEGCDAGETRYRQLVAEYFGFDYAPAVPAEPPHETSSFHYAEVRPGRSRHAAPPGPPVPHSYSRGPAPPPMLGSPPQR